MSEHGTFGTPAGSDQDNPGEAREVIEANGRNIKLANVDTASMASSLNDLFDRVMSGQPYDQGQVRNATVLTNTIVKVLRFEFDVYKHFVKDTPKRPGRPVATVTVAHVAAWLRKRDDTVDKGAGPGLWVINGRPCEEKDLITRANNKRAQRGERAFKIDVDE